MVSCARQKDVSKQVELEYRPKAQEYAESLSRRHHHEHSSSLVSFQLFPTYPCNIPQTLVPGVLWSFLRFIQFNPYLFGYHFGSPFPSFPIHHVACVLALESLHKSCHRTALGRAIRDGRFCPFAVLSFRRVRFAYQEARRSRSWYAPVSPFLVGQVQLKYWETNSTYL